MSRTKPSKKQRKKQKKKHKKVHKLKRDIEVPGAAIVPRSAAAPAYDDPSSNGTYHVGKVGRPARYDPTYHPERVLELMSDGMSKTELCAELKLHPSTFYYWMSKHEEFHEAVEAGNMLAAGWWEGQGRKNLHSQTFNNRLYFMHMSNRFGWSNKAEVKSAVAHLGHFEHHHTAGDVPEQIDATPVAQAQVLKILLESGAMDSVAMSDADDIEDAEYDG